MLDRGPGKGGGKVSWGRRDSGLGERGGGCAEKGEEDLGSTCDVGGQGTEASARGGSGAAGACVAGSAGL